jgi:hypothetical protein
VTRARPVRLRHLLTGVAGQLTLTVVVVAIFAGVPPRIAHQASTAISDDVPPSEPAGAHS